MAGKPKDLYLKCFGALVVVARHGHRGPSAAWLCLCRKCGNDKILATRQLTRDHAIDCGCGLGRRLARRTIKHGLTHSVEYKCWSGIKRRCNNPNFKWFRIYGARGIAICDRWSESFENFYADMGPRPGPNYSIDRINNDGNYEPGNCRWATWSEQCNNMRCRMLTHLGRTKKISQWADEIGVNKKVIGDRIRRKLPIEEVLFPGSLVPLRNKQINRRTGCRLP